MEDKWESGSDGGNVYISMANLNTEVACLVWHKQTLMYRKHTIVVPSEKPGALGLSKPFYILRYNELLNTVLEVAVAKR